MQTLSNGMIVGEDRGVIHRKPGRPIILHRDKKSKNVSKHDVIFKKTVKPKILSNNTFEIFAYCSKNYEDAINFAVPSWSALNSVTKITIYTDWDFVYDDPKVEIIKMFDENDEWIVGTGRRLDVIKDFSDKFYNSKKNILFLDMDCYIVEDVNHMFDKSFDIAISRLNSKENYATKTATAGLWFAKMNDGYDRFVKDWLKEAAALKQKRIGLRKYYISYVQYSFTNIAKSSSNEYKVLPIDEKIYNSEHSDVKKWKMMVARYNPKILHFKGRRFRDIRLIDDIFKILKKDRIV